MYCMYTYLFHTQLHDYNIIYNIKTKNKQAELLLELIAAILDTQLLVPREHSLLARFFFPARACRSLTREDEPHPRERERNARKF